MNQDIRPQPHFLALSLISPIHDCIKTLCLSGLVPLCLIVFHIMFPLFDGVFEIIGEIGIELH